MIAIAAETAKANDDNIDAIAVIFDGLMIQLCLSFGCIKIHFLWNSNKFLNNP